QFINEGQRALRQQSPAGRDAPDRRGGQVPVRKNALQGLFLDQRVRKLVRQPHNSQPLFRQGLMQAHRVGGQHARGQSFPFLLSARQQPLLVITAAGNEDQAGVLHQVRWRLGRPVPCQIGGAGIQAVVERGEVARYQSVVVRQAGSDANRQVKPFRDDVNASR